MPTPSFEIYEDSRRVYFTTDVNDHREANGKRVHPLISVWLAPNGDLVGVEFKDYVAEDILAALSKWSRENPAEEIS